MFPQRIYAHRGAASEVPENTIASFRRAMECGATALEMDVHGTVDGCVVVSHDLDTARMTGVHRIITETTLADLQQLDAGYGFIDGQGNRPWAGKGLTIPTLDKVLEEFPKVIINIDVKQSKPCIVDSVIEITRRHEAEHRVTLASFHHNTVRTIRKRGYRGATALSPMEIAGVLVLPLWVLRRWLPENLACQIPIQRGRIHLANSRFIAKCHSLGIRVDFWTINDQDVAKRLLAMGADGIMTDDPRRIASHAQPSLAL